MARRISFLFLALSVACAGAGRAAELGEANVRSHIGQQLVADIELIGLERPAEAVQVRLASPDVYRGASLDMPPVLSALSMNVMVRDGRQYLHITSLKPVDADHLHLFLELGEGQHRSVRLATLWLTPDPTPPAPVAPAMPAEPAPPPLAWKAAGPRTVPKVHPLPWRAPPQPAILRPAPAPSAPACPAQPEAQADPVCAGLDRKNADLRDQIGKLEAKVLALQALERPAHPAPKAGHDTHAVTAPAPPASQLQRPALPWKWIALAGAAVFALVGAVQFWRTRRARAKAAELKHPVELEPVEPLLEEARAQ
jgi:hypothetical protein